MATKRKVTKRVVAKRDAPAKPAEPMAVPEVLLEAADFFDAGKAADVIRVMQANPDEDWSPFAMGLVRSMGEGSPVARKCAVEVLTALPALVEGFGAPDLFLAACVAEARGIAQSAALALEAADLLPDGPVRSTVLGWREHGHPALADFAEQFLPSPTPTTPTAKA